MKMQCWLLSVGCIVLVGMAAEATELDVMIDLGAKVTSSYTRRGRVVNEDPCFQPSVTVSGGDVSLNVWGTWDFIRTTNSSQRTRVDTTIDYTKFNGKHLMRVGLVAYIYHDSRYTGSRDDTFEAFLDYTLDVPLLPRASIAYDFGSVNGFYFEFSAGHSVGLMKDMADIDVRASVSAADESQVAEIFSGIADLPGKSSLVDARISVAVPVAVSESFVVTPEVEYMTVIDSAIRDAVDTAGENTSYLTYAISVSYMF